MAAAAAKAAAIAKAHAEAVAVEYKSWHEHADLTEKTGVMRLLIVSMALNDDKALVKHTSSSSIGHKHVHRYVPHFHPHHFG